MLLNEFGFYNYQLFIFISKKTYQTTDIHINVFSSIWFKKKKHHHLKQNWIHVNTLQYTPAWFLFDIPLENNNLNICKMLMVE